MKSPDETLLDLATSSQNLQNRAAGNQQYASEDFGCWVQKLLDEHAMNNVLDICCGTGNQLILYAKKLVDSLTGIDISVESIEKSKERLTHYNGELTLIPTAMESYLSKASPNSKDFISSFYGLYYTSNLEETCQQIHRVLQPNCKLLVCGPYGDNNASLFRLLEKYYTLPELVTYSSSSFMQQALTPALEKLGMEIEHKYFINTITYPSVDAIMQYLQSTTFFNSHFHQQIRNDLDKHFEAQSNFKVEKHVMALIACKA